MQRLSLIGVFDKIEKGRRFRHIGQQRKCAEKSAVSRQSCNIFKERMVGHAMIMIHPKTDCRQKRLSAGDLVDGDHRHRIFDDSTKTRFITKNNAIRTAIDQQNQSI